MNQDVIPGILVALDEQRIDDARDLAEVLVEDADPASVALHLAKAALVLHHHPSVSLQQFAMLWAADEDDVELDLASLKGAQVGLEFLDIVEGMDPAAAPGAAASPEVEELLERFAVRPSSKQILRAFALATRLLLTNMRLQMIPPIAARRSSESAERFAFESARAAFAQQPQPNVFGAEWDDKTDEAT